MFKDEADFEKVVGRLNVDTEPNPAHRQKLRRRVLSVFNQAEQESATRIIVFRTLRRIRRLLLQFFLAYITWAAQSMAQVLPGPRWSSN
jgi:hypothetical protein